jgi:NifU-like protein
MLAAADVLSEYVTGRILAELHGLHGEEICQLISSALGGVPAGRGDCAASTIEALKSGFSDLRTKRVQEFRGEEALICTCFGITEETILKLVNELSLNTVEEVGDACNAGTGCGSCIMLIDELLNG